MSVIDDLLGANGFMPHGMCYLWQPGILTLHVTSDALIGASYLSIPFTLAHFVRKRRDLDFDWMIVCFAIFIVACGMTHIAEIVTIWQPVYWVSGAIKAVTAAASVPTAILLVKLMPQALRWPSPAALKRANDELHLVNARLLGEAAERKRAQEEVQRINQELQDQLADMRRLHEAVRQARDAADHANGAKSRFLATASHDLRQPLQAIALLNGALSDELADRPETLEVIVQQEQAITSMSRLLNALLDISKLESGAIQPEPHDFLVGTLFQELRSEFTTLAQSKGLDLRVVSCERSVHSDRSLVGQILRNLLANAIKFTRSGWVALRCVHESSFLRLEVLDTGIGIPSDQLRHIYDEFYQAGVPTNSTREGYGLGLSIVRRLVTLLDAKLDVRSEVGKGSTFALTLPVGGTAVSQSPNTPQPSVTAEPIPTRILLVEDDHSVRNATHLLLKRNGFHVIAAVSMDDALRQLADEPQIDLLVTDYHLQDGKTGTEVIAAVRAALNRQLKAVLVTGDTSSVVAELSRDRLMRVVSKPVNAKELLGLLKGLLATD